MFVCVESKQDDSCDTVMWHAHTCYYVHILLKATMKTAEIPTAAHHEFRFIPQEVTVIQQFSLAARNPA